MFICTTTTKYYKLGFVRQANAGPCSLQLPRQQRVVNLRELRHVHVLGCHLLHQVFRLGTTHGEHRVHGRDVLHRDAPVGGKVVEHPLEDASLLRGRRHHDEVAGVLADEEAVVLVAALLVVHSGGHDAADGDVDVVGAEVLEVGHHCAGLAADHELGEGGHVDDAHALATNEILLLDVVEKIRLAEGPLGQLRRRVLPGVEGVEVERPLPAHPLSEDGPSGLELAEERRSAYLATASEFVDERILK